MSRWLFFFRDWINYRRGGTLLLLSVLLVYSKGLKNGYSLDDIYGPQNPLVEKGISGIPQIFTTPMDVKAGDFYEYRPVSLTSFAVENSLFGKGRPMLSHLINLLLYALICWVLFSLLFYLFPKFEYPSYVLFSKHILCHFSNLLAIFLHYHYKLFFCCLFQNLPNFQIVYLLFYTSHLYQLVL